MSNQQPRNLPTPEKDKLDRSKAGTKQDSGSGKGAASHGGHTGDSQGKTKYTMILQPLALKR